jgi:hypothetical protein
MPLLPVGMMRSPLQEDLLALRRVVGDQRRVQLDGLTGLTVAELVARWRKTTGCYGWQGR